MVARKSSGWVFAALLLLLTVVSGCKSSDLPAQDSADENAEGQHAAWLSDLIRELEQEPPANPPAKLYRYNYKEQEVYYLPSRCCDIPGKVYDVDGNLLCEPEGGITGKGDGRCTDFLETRTNETLIWEDKRES
ncbi:hypothetical protein OB13_02775 [Pontibacter sp. HJ8]